MSLRTPPAWLVGSAWWRRHLLPVLVVVPAAFAPDGEGAGGVPSVFAGLCVLVMTAVLLVRLRLPGVAVAAATGLAVLSIATTGPIVAAGLTLMIVVFSAARHTDRRTTIVLAVPSALVVGLAAALLLPEVWGNFRPFLQFFGLVGFAAAAGDGARSRAAYISAITERAQRAEETKESEARSRVAEERLKIARDLHDVMAHQIAVINLHAAVASQALGTRPEDAERSLVTIRESARTVLAEIGSLLQVLRASPGAVVSASPDTPVPGLAQLDRLIATFERSGLRIDLRTVGTPVPLPEEVDVVAYRVIQEGLTNAQKHGADSSALLQIEYDERTLEVTVTNTVASGTKGAADQRSGHGLVGARERAAAIGGTVHTSFVPGSVHRLTVRLPMRPAPDPPADPVPASPPAVVAGGAV